MLEMRGILQHSINQFGSQTNNSIQTNFFFDEIVNRRNQSSAIKIEISWNGCLLNILIHPNGQQHTQNVRIDVSSTPNPQVPRDDFVRHVSALIDTMYIGAFRGVDFNFTGSTGEMSVGQHFINMWSQWAGGDDVQNRTRIGQLENELKELLGFKEFGITLNSASNALLVTTDDGQFKLSELGGGISQLIMLLGNAAIKNPSFILIDEPEINLHPRMQEVLVRALASKAKLGLIASSHSVGLARSTAERTFSLTRFPDGSVRLAPFGQHYTPTIAQSINELGYSQFVEVGGNNILLVEGRTDVKAYRELLSKYGIETSFIILPFGGREFILADKTKIVDELNEIKRLNPKSISVIFDSDIASAGASLAQHKQAFKECCESLGFNVFATDRASTENYISQDALDRVLRNTSAHKALGAYEAFNSLASGKWDKNMNWLLFKETSKANFDATGLGKFVETVLKPFA